MQFIKQSQFRRLFLVLLLLFVGGAVWSSVQVIKLSKEVESLQSQVLSLEKQVGNAQSRLDYIIPIAENADRYVHSHEYGW